jgi:hypothetical protein
MLSRAEAPDSAVQGGLPKAGYDPAVPLRVPGREERVEAVRDGLRAADELRLRGPATLLVLVCRRDRRERGGVDRRLAPLEGAGAASEVEFVRGRTVGEHYGADILPNVAAHLVRYAPCEQSQEGTDREASLHLNLSFSRNDPYPFWGAPSLPELRRRAAAIHYTSMIRKQIYLPEELERRLSVASKQQQKSEAELVREALEDRAAAPVSAGAALMKLAELGRRLDITLPADASAKHDDYLYGDGK